MLFLITGYFKKVEKQIAYSHTNFTGLIKVHLANGSWSSSSHESLLCFGKVPATMISKSFVKLGIIVYYRTL